MPTIAALASNDGELCDCCQAAPEYAAPAVKAGNIVICTDCLRQSVAVHAAETRRRVYGAPEILGR
jgi:hypothetical protein